MFKWLMRKLRPGPREISKEEMTDKIDEMQHKFGIPEDQVPWKEMRNEKGPCEGCTCGLRTEWKDQGTVPGLGCKKQDEGEEVKDDD